MEITSTFSHYYMFSVYKCVGHKSTDKFHFCEDEPIAGNDACLWSKAVKR